MKLSKKSVINRLRDPTSGLQTIVLTTLTAAIYLARAFPYFIKPQLYAEDGVVWLSKAVSDGAITLIPKTYNGFFHYPERLFAFIVAHFSLYWAPAIFATAAWLLFIALVYYLFSDRTKILTHNFERLFMVFALGMIANFGEFFFNFSNSIFLMGIIGGLILVAKKSENRLVDVLEKIFFLLTCTALPFSWVYVPITVFDRLKYKTKNTYFIIVSTITALAQAVGYATSHTDRSPVTVMSLFSKWMLLEIYNQIIVPAIRFARVDFHAWELAGSRYPLAIVGLSVLAVAVAGIVTLRKSNRQLLLFMLFLVGMTAASLKSPTVHVKSATDALKYMADVTDGNRYFIYGILAVNLIFIKTVYASFTTKARYIFITFFMAFGVVSSVRYHSLKVDKHWRDYRNNYHQGVEAYSNGAKQVTFPVNPKPWSMGLFRK